MKLLIVEDSKLVSERLRCALGGIVELETEFADCFDLGVARFHQAEPDLVLSDIQLPDGNGIDFLRMVKRERPDTPVLMFSNYPFFRQRCAAEGADYFFDKSMEFEDLVSTVKSLAEVAS